MIRRIYNTPCGKLLLEVICGKVNRCCWAISQIERAENGDATPEDIRVMRDVVSRLDEYFRGELVAFDIPLHMMGTPFRKKVWKFLQTIPYGETMTYGEIAKGCGCKGGQRAVAQACSANRLAILVPCHRVIRSDGSLGGYTISQEGKEKGKLLEGIAIKQYLLNHETIILNNQ